MRAPALRITGIIALLSTSGCQRNRVVEVDLSAVEGGGTYVMMGLATDAEWRPHEAAALSEGQLRALRSRGITATSPFSPPVVAEKSRSMPRSNVNFRSAESDGCFVLDQIEVPFPQPGKRVAYRIFEVPPSRYVLDGTLKAGDDYWNSVPAFQADRGQVTFIGTFHLERNEDIRVDPDPRVAQRLIRTPLRATALTPSEPLGGIKCTP